MHRRIAVIACIASLLSTLPGLAYAVPGALDATFSGDGIVTTPMANSYATDVALDSAGRIYAVGEMDDDTGVVRYTRRGKLDTSFSGDGIATTGPAGSIGEAHGVAVDASDRPVGGAAVGGIRGGPSAAAAGIAGARTAAPPREAPPTA